MADQCIKVINTKLSGFILLNSLTEVDEEHICGTSRFSDARPCLGMECLAQLGALHVRFLTDFQKHVFLAKITRCYIPEQMNLNGIYQFGGRLSSRSSAAFSYELTATQGKKLEIRANFLYAAVDYDDSFKREKLQDHYRRIFACLKNAAGQDLPRG